MKHLLSCLAAMIIAVAAIAQPKPVLRYNADGKFKILQLTDVHYKFGKDGSKRALANINSVLDSEHPDFVILTGDQVYAAPVGEGLGELLVPIVSRGIPFATVFGNHDHQFDMTLAEQYDLVQAYSLSVMPERGDAFSPDYTVELRSAHSDSVANVFYCLDSHDASRLPGTGKYDWLKPEQIMWYVDRSRFYTDENAGRKVPALMFFHIPLPEFDYALSVKKPVMFGNKGEKVCSPLLNSGMFTALRGEGDVLGVFCGHDHDNDFSTAYCDILLAYGRYSGGDTVYNHLKPSGARVIELTEGSRGLRTWIRLADGSVINETSYPADYIKK